MIIVTLLITAFIFELFGIIQYYKGKKALVNTGKYYERSYLFMITCIILLWVYIIISNLEHYVICK